MFLDATNKSIKVTADAAATVTEAAVTAHYVDYTATATTPAETDVLTNGTTPVTAVAAPAASTQRHVKYMSICNQDTVAHVYTVAYVNNTNTRQIVLMALAAGRTAEYTQAQGWHYVPTGDPQHVEKDATITAENTFTAPLLVKAGDVVSVSVGGTGWSALISLQRMLDGVNWNTVTLPDTSDGWTAAVEMTYLADETGYLRLGATTGNFSSGSIPVRLGVN